MAMPVDLGKGPTDEQINKIADFMLYVPGSKTATQFKEALRNLWCVGSAMLIQQVLPLGSFDCHHQQSYPPAAHRLVCTRTPATSTDPVPLLLHRLLSQAHVQGDRRHVDRGEPARRDTRR